MSSIPADPIAEAIDLTSIIYEKNKKQGVLCELLRTQFANIASAFQKAADASTSPNCKSRLTYIYKKLIERIVSSTDITCVANVSLLCATTLQKLQEEAISYAVLEPLMNARISDSTRPDLAEGREAFGHMRYVIKIATREELAKIPAPRLPCGSKPLHATKRGGFEGLIEKLLARIAPEELDRILPVLFKLVNGYSYKYDEETGNSWYTVIDRDSKKVTQELCSHSHPLIRSLAQYLMNLHLRLDFEDTNTILTKMVPCVIGHLQTITLPPESEDNCFRELVPIFYRLIDVLQPHSVGGAEKETIQQSIFSLRICQHITDFATPSWREENKKIYGYLARLKIIADAAFKNYTPKSKGYQQLNAGYSSAIQDITTNNLDGQLASILREFLLKAKVRERYPLDVLHPFGESEEDFLKISLSPDFQSKISEHDRQRILEAQAKSLKKPKKPRHTAASVSAGAGGGGSAGALDKTPEPASSYLPAAREMPELLSSSVFENPLIRGLTLDLRVALWNTNPREALRLYQHDSSHRFSEEEMIFRHDLPIGLLPLMLDPSYGRKGKWQAGSLTHDHWDALVRVTKPDGTSSLYIVEATIDNKTCLYHYYMKDFNLDGLIMSLEAPSQFPPLGKKDKGTAPAAARAVFSEDLKDSMTFDPEGNASIAYKDMVFTVLILN
jgi:hypothetical protein